MFYFFQNLRETAMSNMFFYVSLAFVADVLTGHIKALITHKPSSVLSFEGILRNVLRVAGALIGATIAHSLGATTIENWLLIFIIFGYGISILENYTESGVAVPEFLKNIFKEAYENANKGEKI